MRKQSWFTKSFYSLLLMLLSSAAFADSGSPKIAADAVTNHSDISLSFLGSIFGTVGNVLQGSSGQMLGKLFYSFNLGVLCVVGFLMAYTVVMIVFRTATEGSFMGANKNVHVIILRIALGVGFLIPSSATGYCLLQDVVMKVVVESVALADMTWSSGLTYLQNGGSLWRPPMNNQDYNHASASTQEFEKNWAAFFGAHTIGAGPHNNMISADDRNAITDGVLGPIFQSEVCMEASSIKSYLSSSSKSTGTYVEAGTGQYFHPIEGRGQGMLTNRFTFPGLQGGDAGCGAISWTLVQGTSALYSPQMDMSRQTMHHVVDGMLPLAKMQACSAIPGSTKTPVCSGVDTSALGDDAKQTLFSNLMAYVNGIMPIAQHNANLASGSLNSFLSTAKDAGWMTAGRYYWDLMHYQDNYSNAVELKNYVPNKKTIVAPSNLLTDKDIKSAYTNAMKQFGTTGSQVGPNTYKAALNKLFDNYSNAADAGQNNKNGIAVVGMPGMKFFGPLLNALGNMGADIGSIVAQFDPSNAKQQNPIFFLHSIGVKCFSVAGGMLIGMVAICAAIGMGTIICQSSFNLSTPIQMGLNWLEPFMILIGTALLGVGAILAVYLPLYPFMIFLFAVVSWLIAVIEAMAAAPLVAYGLTHPEGHDFLGEAKQALMLLLGVFLRPTLIIIGMIASMILTFVSFRILIYTFSGVCSDLLNSTSQMSVGSGAVVGSIATAANTLGQGGGEGTFVVAPLLLVIFAGLSYMLINQSFSLVYVLPDYIMRWIGAPTSQSMVAELAGKMQGVASAAGKSMGDMTGATGQALSKNGPEMAGKLQSEVKGLAASGASGGDAGSMGGGAPGN